MTNYSCGPWYPGHLGSDGGCQCRSVVNEGWAGGIATVHMDNGIPLISEGGNDAPPKEEAIANMHLIASAPVLYEALAALVAKPRSLHAQMRAVVALGIARGEHQD